MRPLPIAVSALLLLTTMGCSGVSRTTAPSENPAPQGSGTGPLATVTSNGDAVQAVSRVFALNELVLTRAENGEVTASFDPVRGAQAMGDSFNVEGTTLFNTSPCGDCLKVVGLGYDPAGRVLVDVQLRHPFALPPLPYTQISRLDLHAFDVMGYIVTNGPGDPLVFDNGSVLSQPVLANADGFSNFYDDALEPYLPTPGVTEHPYRLFFRDDLAGNFDASNPNGFGDLRDPQGHNTMAMGETSIVQYALTLPGSTNELRVGLAIGLSWGQGAKGRGDNLTQRQSPVYYLPEFHHKAPWTVAASLRSNTLVASDTSSSATLEVRLRDWQRGATLAAPFDFPNTPRDQVSSASDLQSLAIEIPGILDAPIALDPITPESGTGLYDDAVWAATFQNTLGADAGSYYAWVKATDNMVPAGNAGIDRTLEGFFTVDDYHTGALVAITVGGVSNFPPDAVLGPDPARTCSCGSIRFDAGGSTDPDGGVLTYAWDFDLPSGDPRDFVEDTSTVESFTSHQYCGAQNTFAAVKVCDAQGGCDIAVVPVEIGVGGLDPQAELPVLAANAIPSQDISNNMDGYNNVPHFFSAYDAGSRFAVAGDYIYVMVNSPIDNSEEDPINYFHRQHLLVSNDGGLSWTPGAVLDQSWIDPDPGVPDTDVYPWPHVMLVASPDGTLYYMGSQGRPDFYQTELRMWTSTNHGADPWVERYFGVGDPFQKYSISGAVDPTNPSNVIMTYNCGTTVYFSLNSSNGAEGPWSKVDMGSHNSAGGFAAVLLYAQGGKAYHVSARFSSDAGQDAVYVRRSFDHGASWELAAEQRHNAGVFAHGAGAIDPNDPTGDSFSYVARFSEGGSSDFGVYLFHSSDAGATLEQRQSTLGGGLAVEHSPRVRYDNSGQLVVAWSTFDGRLQGALSSDNGLSFDTPVDLVTGNITAGYIEPIAGTCDFLVMYQRNAMGGEIGMRVF